MLEEINIKNLGVIQEAHLPFTKGLNVITGETGAGKTMVLTALGLLLGRKSDSAMVRHGASSLTAEGCWYVSDYPVIAEMVESVGGELEEGQLFINRSVTSEGKSKAVVGGRATPASLLANIGDNLVSIHGQSDQIRLKNVNAQREALDKYACKDLKELLSSYVVSYESWKKLNKTLEDVKNNMASRQREFEELTEAVEKISVVSPSRGEDEELKADIERLMNVENIRSGMEAASLSMSNDEFDSKDLLELLNIVLKSLKDVEEFDSKISEMVTTAESIKISVNDLAHQISSYLDSIDGDQIVMLNQSQERLSAVNSLIRRYGGSLDSVLDYFESAGERLLELDPSNNNVEALEAELGKVFEEMKKLAEEIHDVRLTAGENLANAVNSELKGLAMGGSTFVIEVEKTDSYSTYGADNINFLLSPHPNAIPRPLGKGASGGELSRIMLALEVVLADPEATPTFVFDEVDSGVGGASAIEIGKRLAILAKQTQVIVVTHLPQVAVFADNHLRVLKNSGDDFIATDVVQLSEEDRVSEIARMLSGLSESDSGQAHAKEMIDKANQFKA